MNHNHIRTLIAATKPIINTAIVLTREWQQSRGTPLQASDQDQRIALAMSKLHDAYRNLEEAGNIID